MLTIGSLFSGIGGLELGLERAGLGPVLWQVERDEYCRRILAKHWPDVERFEDVEHATGLPAVDLVCGGFPCQPASVAGSRRGRDDHRWLWPQFSRIVGEVLPRFVVVENVSGLLSLELGRAFGEVVGDLASLGYRVEWLNLRASDVGAPHRRARIFVVAWRVPDQGRAEPGNVRGTLGDANRTRLEGRVSEQAQGRARPSARGGDVADASRVRCDERRAGQPRESAVRPTGALVADPDGGRRQGGGLAEYTGLEGARGDAAHGCRDDRQLGWPPGPGDREGWADYVAAGGPEPAICGGADGLSRRLDGARRRRLGVLGNAVVPAVVEEFVGPVVRRIAGLM